MRLLVLDTARWAHAARALPAMGRQLDSGAGGCPPCMWEPARPAGLAKVTAVCDTAVTPRARQCFNGGNVPDHGRGREPAENVQPSAGEALDAGDQDCTQQQRLTVSPGEPIDGAARPGPSPTPRARRPGWDAASSPTHCCCFLRCAACLCAPTGGPMAGRSGLVAPGAPPTPGSPPATGCGQRSAATCQRWPRPWTSTPRSGSSGPLPWSGRRCRGR